MKWMRLLLNQHQTNKYLKDSFHPEMCWTGAPSTGQRGSFYFPAFEPTICGVFLCLVHLFFTGGNFFNH